MLYLCGPSELLKELLQREAERGIEPDPVVDAIMKVRWTAGMGVHCAELNCEGVLVAVAAVSVNRLAD